MMPISVLCTKTTIVHFNDGSKPVVMNILILIIFNHIYTMYRITRCVVIAVKLVSSKVDRYVLCSILSNQYAYLCIV